MNNFEKIERIRKKIFHLKNKTVANGCTPSEELAAKNKIFELNQIIYSLQNNSHRSYFTPTSRQEQLLLEIREIEKQMDIELEKIENLLKQQRKLSFWDVIKILIKK